MKTRVSTKGQIILPAEIRSEDHIKAGEEFEIEPVAVTGPATDNQVGIEIIERRLGVRAANALTQGAALGDLIQDQVGLASASTEVAP